MSDVEREGERMEQEPNGERAAKVAIGVMSALGGVAGGALAAGIWAGGVRASLESHMGNPEIHQSRAQKEGIAQVVVDREVRPILADIQRRLERIENKLDERWERE